MAAQNNDANNVPHVDMLADVIDQRDDWNLLVRVVRMWRVPDVSSSCLPFALELVIMDSAGTRIHASIKKQLLYKFEREFAEGEIYYMAKFLIGPNIGEYRSTRHSLKLSFHINTKIKKANGLLLPAPVYTFANPAECFQLGFEADYLVDIIGVLTGVEQQREYVRNGIKSKLMTIELDNMGYCFKFTLFGQFVDELNSFISSGENANAVVAVLFSKVKDWQGRKTLQSTMHSSKLLINPDIPEAIELRNNVAVNQESPNLVISQIQEPVVSNIEDDLIYQTPATTIAQLNNYSETGFFVVFATVTNIDDNGDWWYSACRCNKKVQANENAYYCERCNKHVFSVTPRYLLKLRVNDGTGTADLVLFEDEAVVLIKKSCAVLLDTMVNPNPFGFPREISALIGKRFLFKVRCAGLSDTKFERSFRVKKVSDDAQILQKFKHKWDAINGDQHCNNSSNSVMVSVGAELAADVAQDLMNKFEETSRKGKEVVVDHEIIDLCESSQQSPPTKRSCPYVDEELPSYDVLKEIKKEKE